MIVTYEMLELGRTPGGALKCRMNDNQFGVHFLPLSQIDIEPVSGCVVRVTMPCWLAEEKGLA